MSSVTLCRSSRASFNTREDAASSQRRPTRMTSPSVFCRAGVLGGGRRAVHFLEEGV